MGPGPQGCSSDGDKPIAEVPTPVLGGGAPLGEVGTGGPGLASGADPGWGGWWRPVWGQEVSSGCWVGQCPRLKGRLVSPSSRRRASRRKGLAARQRSSCRLGGLDRVAFLEEAASLQGHARRGRPGGPGLPQQRRARALSDYTAFRCLPLSEVGQAKVRMKEEQCVVKTRHRQSSEATACYVFSEFGGIHRHSLLSD